MTPITLITSSITFTLKNLHHKSTSASSSFPLQGKLSLSLFSLLHSEHCCYSSTFIFNFRTRVLFEDLYCQMGKSKNEEYENKEKEGIKKSHYFMVFISSLLISITGGSLLGWWLHKYHPTNKQLWMVPFGLILLFTPFIVCLSVIISGPAIHKNDEEDVLNINQRIQPLDRLF